MNDGEDVTQLDVALGPVVVDQEWMERFSLGMMEAGNEGRSLHLNEELAREKGLETTVLEGRMAVSLISRLLAGAVGDRWMASGELEVRYRRMMLRGSALTARATYGGGERRDGRDVIRLDVWVESDREDRPVVGTGWIPAR